MAKIVLQMNGASPWYLKTSEDLEAEVVVLDWDEVNAGAYTYDQLLDLAEDVVPLCPEAARDLRIAAAEQREDN
jgi:hypothetical protein